MHAADGKIMSGVEVATMIRSIVAGSQSVAASACRAAFAAKSLQAMSASAKCRARMPVRSTIHSSEVSMPRSASWRTSSALATRRGGRKLPVPAMRE